MRRKTTAVLFLILLSSLLIKLPVALSALEGNSIGGDVATYVYWSKVTLEEEKIPDWVEYTKGLELPSRFAPGVPVLFSVLSLSSGIDPVNFSPFFRLFVFILIDLSLFVFLKRLFDERNAVIGLLFWVFAQPPILKGVENEVLTMMSPEAFFFQGGPVPNIIGILFLTFFLFTAFLFTKNKNSTNLILMMLLSLASLIHHQLTLLVIGIFFLAFILFYFREITWKSALPFFAAFALFSIFFSPSYVSLDSVGAVTQGSDYVSTSLQFSEILTSFGFASFLFFFFGCIHLTRKRNFFYLYLLSLSAIILLVSAFAPLVINLNSMRFSFYLPLLLLPMALLGVREVEKTLKSKNAFVILVLVVFISLGTLSQLKYQEHFLEPRFLFNPEEKEAAEWIRENMKENEILVADFRESRDTAWLKPFTMKTVLLRPMPLGIKGTPSPYNEPLEVIDSVLSDPSDSSSVAEFQSYNFTYVYFSSLDEETNSFGVSRYFYPVFENSAARIFRINGTL